MIIWDWEEVRGGGGLRYPNQKPEKTLKFLDQL